MIYSGRNFVLHSLGLSSHPSRPGRDIITRLCSQRQQRHGINPCLLIMNHRLYSHFLFGVKIAFLISYPPVSGDQVNVISTCTLAISLVVVVQYGTLIALKRKPQVFENFQKIYKKNLRRHKYLILLPQFRVISHSLPRSKQLLKWNCLFPQSNTYLILHMKVHAIPEKT